jgi:exonuclease SbcC
MTMITKVKLKNWRSHLDTEFDFSSGTNALLGSMGSGKSSTMDAICFAFFGTFPTLQSKKIKLDDMIMKKPVEKDKSEVEIIFEIDSKRYSIRRVIEKGRGTSYSEVREDGKLLDAPSSQRVTEVVEKILKVDYELFSKAIYSEQNALDYFLVIPKGQRMKKIDELLSIDKFEKARGNAVSLVNKFVERKFAKQTIIDQTNVEELQKGLEDTSNGIEQITDEMNLLKDSFTRIKLEKSTVEQEITDLKKIKEAIEKLRLEERGVKSVLDETEKSIKKSSVALEKRTKDDVKKILEDLIKNLEIYEAELKNKQKIYEEMTSSINQYKAKIEFVSKEKIRELEKAMKEKLGAKKEYDHLRNRVGDDALQQIERKDKEFEELRNDAQKLMIKIKEFEETIEFVSSSEGVCPVCESRLTEERKNLLIEEKRRKISEFREKLDGVNKKVELTEEEIKNLQEACKKLEQMFEQIKDLEETNASLESSKKMFIELTNLAIRTENELTEIKRSVEELNKKVEECRDKKQKFEILSIQMKDYEEKMGRLEELFKEKEHLEERINELEEGTEDRNLSEFEEKFKKLIADEKEIETKIKGLEELKREKEERLRSYQDKLEVVGKQKEEVKKIEDMIKNLRIFSRGLEETQIQLRKEFVDTVNYTTNDLWPTIYPYKDFIGIKLNIEEGDYVLQLQERSGGWVNVEGFASGGERSIAALTLRIAFSLVLAPQLKWLVLDEPTHNLDVKAVEDLAQTLKDRIGKFVEQVFLITHDEKLEDAVTGSCYVLEREKGKDGVTKVSSVS